MTETAEDDQERSLTVRERIPGLALMGVPWLICIGIVLLLVSTYADAPLRPVVAPLLDGGLLQIIWTALLVIVIVILLPILLFLTGLAITGARGK